MAVQPAHSCQADEPGSAVLVGSGGNFWSALVRLPGERRCDMRACEKQVVSVNTPNATKQVVPGQNPTTDVTGNFAQTHTVKPANPAQLDKYAHS